MDNFNLKNFILENKLARASRLIESEDVTKTDESTVKKVEEEKIEDHIANYLEVAEGFVKKLKLLQDLREKSKKYGENLSASDAKMLNGKVSDVLFGAQDLALYNKKTQEELSKLVNYYATKARG